MKRSPLKRGKPLAPKSSRPKAGRKRTKYSQRDRDFVYMGWIRKLPCTLLQMAMATEFSPLYRTNLSIGMTLATWLGGDIDGCYGPTEAHHAGSHGLGQKAPDRTCVPLCASHHRALTDRTGVFSRWPSGALKTWELAAVEYYNARFVALAAAGDPTY